MGRATGQDSALRTVDAKSVQRQPVQPFVTAIAASQRASPAAGQLMFEMWLGSCLLCLHFGDCSCKLDDFSPTQCLELPCTAVSMDAVLAVLAPYAATPTAVLNVSKLTHCMLLLLLQWYTPIAS